MDQPTKQFGNRPRPSEQNYGGRQQYRGQAPPPQLPTPNPLVYFTDAEKNTLNPNLVDEGARESAEAFKRLKVSQMRRFYDELKAIERRIMVGKDIKEQQANFERDRSLIAMFKAKAVYAEKRKVSPREFTQFIFDHVASINDIKDFKGFLKVFEAVVAFHKFFSPEN